MSHLTITWHARAYADVAQMFVDAVDRGRISRAIDEIESLLRVSPETKGNQLYAGQQSTAVLEELYDRMTVIPESIRRLELGPIEVFFTCQPEDGQTRVWHLRLRKK